MWDVLYAVDASASMGEKAKGKSGPPFVKIEGVKAGIAQVVTGSALPFAARIGVMAFRAPTRALGMMLDSSKDIIQEVLPLTPVHELRADPGRLSVGLGAMTVGGATPTGEALKRGVEILHSGQDAARRRIKRLVLVTDEKSNVGPKPEAILDPALVRSAIVDVVAIGSGADRKTLGALASRTGGRFVQASSAPELAVALNPKIPYSDPPGPIPVIDEASRVFELLNSTDRKAASYQGVAAAARAVRAKLEQKLHETSSLVGQARGDLDLVVSAAMRDPKWPSMSMKEYSERVWSRGADLSKLQEVEDRYRRALQAT